MADAILNKEQINTAIAFDAEAQKYDAVFSHSAIGQLQRRRVRYFMNKVLSPTAMHNILELNCGTGEDALWLASKSGKVLATDISEKMIQIAKEKTAGLSNVDTIQLSFTHVTSELAGNKFDLVFSNFGGINCAAENELAELGKQLYNLTGSNATIAFVVMSANCWWEKIYFFWKGIKRRRKTKTTANLNGVAFPVWYYSPKQLETIFKPHFEKKYQKPIGLFIPPSYLDSFFKRKSFLLNILFALEKIFGSFNFLADNADHYLMVFKKKSV